MLKKIIPIMIFGLLSTSIVSSTVLITNCRSGNIPGECEQAETCTCYIAGTCTDGNLLVYKTSMGNLYCAPQIKAGKAEIDWDECGNPSGTIYAVADCDEGQSSAEKIEIVEGKEEPISCGISGYCESKAKGCKSDYERCSSYDDECSSDKKCCCLKEPEKELCPHECCVGEIDYEDQECDPGYSCVNNVCKKADSEGGSSKWLIIGFIIILMIAGIVFFIIKKGKSAEKEESELFGRFK